MPNINEPKRYPINMGALHDMARIPDSALPYFLEELPGMLRTYRAELTRLQGLCYSIPKPKKLWWMTESRFRRSLAKQLTAQFVANSPVWVDDGRGSYGSDGVGFQISGPLKGEG
jgi:hypothetical protein